MPDDPEPSLWKRLFSPKQRLQPLKPIGNHATPLHNTHILPPDMPVQQALAYLLKHNSKTAAVGTHDQITGHINTFLCLKNPEQSLHNIQEKASILPESLYPKTAMKRLRQDGALTAYLVDEKGFPTGSITMEKLIDIIHYPNKKSSPLPVENLQDLPGNTPVDKVFQTLTSSIPETNRQTIGGWILEQIGRIPAQQEVLHLKEMTVTILETDARTIKRIHISKGKHHD